MYGKLTPEVADIDGMGVVCTRRLPLAMLGRSQTLTPASASSRDGDVVRRQPFVGYECELLLLLVTW